MKSRICLIKIFFIILLCSCSKKDKETEIVETIGTLPKVIRYVRAADDFRDEYNANFSIEYIGNRINTIAESNSSITNRFHYENSKLVKVTSNNFDRIGPGYDWSSTEKIEYNSENRITRVYSGIQSRRDYEYPNETTINTAYYRRRDETEVYQYSHFISRNILDENIVWNFIEDYGEKNYQYDSSFSPFKDVGFFKTFQIIGFGPGQIANLGILCRGKNNVTKIEDEHDPAYTRPDTNFEYEFSIDGLPTKIIIKGGEVNKVIETFDFEY